MGALLNLNNFSNLAMVYSYMGKFCANLSGSFKNRERLVLTLIYASEREGGILGDYEILSGPMVIGLAGRWPLKQVDHNFDC